MITRGVLIGLALVLGACFQRSELSLPPLGTGEHMQVLVVGGDEGASAFILDGRDDDRLDLNVIRDEPVHLLGFRQSAFSGAPRNPSLSAEQGCLDPVFANASSVYARNGSELEASELPGWLQPLGPPKARISDCIQGRWPDGSQRRVCVEDDRCSDKCGEHVLESPAAPECPSITTLVGDRCVPLPDTTCDANEWPLFPGLPCLTLHRCPSGRYADNLPASGVRYVDSAAPAGGDGSLAAPFNTLGEAVSGAGPGQTLALAPGAYTTGRGVNLDGLNLIGPCAPFTTVGSTSSSGLSDLKLSSGTARIEGVLLQVTIQITGGSLQLARVSTNHAISSRGGDVEAVDLRLEPGSSLNVRGADATLSNVSGEQNNALQIYDGHMSISNARFDDSFLLFVGSSTVTLTDLYVPFLDDDGLGTAFNISSAYAELRRVRIEHASVVSAFDAHIVAEDVYADGGLGSISGESHMEVRRAQMVGLTYNGLSINESSATLTDVRFHGGNVPANQVVYAFSGSSSEIVVSRMYATGLTAEAMRLQGCKLDADDVYVRECGGLIDTSVSSPQRRTSNNLLRRVLVEQSEHVALELFLRAGDDARFEDLVIDRASTAVVLNPPDPLLFVASIDGFSIHDASKGVSSTGERIRLSDGVISGSPTPIEAPGPNIVVLSGVSFEDNGAPTSPPGSPAFEACPSEP